MATSTFTERDPLLRNDIPAAGDSVTVGKVQEANDLRNGPLEIAPSTRYGILAGVWTATFLAVRLLAVYSIVS